MPERITLWTYNTSWLERRLYFGAKRIMSCHKCLNHRIFFPLIYLFCFTIWPVYLTSDSSNSHHQSYWVQVGNVFERVVDNSTYSKLAVDRSRQIRCYCFLLKAKLINRKLRAALLFATWVISTAYSMFYYFETVKIGQETYC